MENLSKADSRLLPGFGPGEGIISGQAVRFPLVVRINFDENLACSSIGDEDFVEAVAQWTKSGQVAVQGRSDDLESAIKAAGKKTRQSLSLPPLTPVAAPSRTNMHPFGTRATVHARMQRHGFQRIGEVIRHKYPAGSERTKEPLERRLNDTAIVFATIIVLVATPAAIYLFAVRLCCGQCP